MTVGRPLFGAIALAALAWSAAAAAQSTARPVVPQAAPGGAAPAQGSGVPELVRKAPAAAMPDGDRASRIIGARVRSTTDDAIGSITDLIVAGPDAAVHAIISMVGVRGAGERLVAIPYADLSIRPDGTIVVAAATRDRPTIMPAFTWRG